MPYRTTTNAASGSAHHHSSERIQDESDEHAGREQAVDQRDACFGLQHPIAECPPGARLGTREDEHRNDGGGQPGDAEQRMMRSCCNRQDVDGLSADVDGEQSERDSDHTERASLAVAVSARQLPDDDERGDDLDQRVEPEAGQRDGMCQDRGREDDRSADDVPGERDVLEPKPPRDQSPRLGEEIR